jgi:tetratricopeptide (TPR) repeat protein
MPAMRRLLTLLAMIVTLGGSVSCASHPGGYPRSAGLDDLFHRLRTAQNPQEAQMIEVAIRHVWANSGSPSVNAMIVQAAEAAHAGRYDEALSTLDRVVQIAPNFAEGWNLRATVHYLEDDYGEAIVDIERVLAIEPRHFGALAGLGRIMLEMEDKKAALWAFDHALSINPYLDDVREEAAGLREELAGLPI